MTYLCCNCWVGEYGWELFCWQGYLRRLSKKYDETIVACRRGHEILYQDFAETISQDINCCESNMWNCKGYRYPTFEKVFGKKKGRVHIVTPPVVRYDHTHRLDSESIFSKFKEQDFVKYGTKTNDGYDILLHIRNKNNLVNNNVSSDYRNWPISCWKELLNSFKNYKIACIGTKQEALHLYGDDLRGISIAELVDIMASSKVIVGPSSGPIHLAALCDCPQVTWYGEPYSIENQARFEKDWNPFKAPVTAMRHPGWNPTVYDVSTQVRAYLAV